MAKLLIIEKALKINPPVEEDFLPVESEVLSVNMSGFRCWGALVGMFGLHNPVYNVGIRKFTIDFLADRHDLGSGDLVAVGSTVYKLGEVGVQKRIYLLLEIGKALVVRVVAML